MRIKLGFLSLITIGLLSGFVLAIIAALAYFGGFFEWPILLTIIVIWNFLIWLLSPYISDFIYKWFYKIEFYTYDQIKDEEVAKFIKKVCDEHKIKFPKIGIIKDRNPTAFTYGSASFNARIIFTEGLMEFLDEEEVEAVVAHEIGHIVNKDFIIMTIAATLLQILYELYVIFARSRSRSSASIKANKKGEDRGNALIVIGYISYFFYWIGTYLLLFLSRTREYYADEFSAKKTGNPNALSTALIKIAYGISTVPDTEKTAHLLNNTRAQGIFDFKAAKDVSVISANSKKDKTLLEKAFLFDIVNPWAFLQELKSTHPLVAKRIRHLSKMTSKPFLDIDKAKKDIDYSKMWKSFLTEFTIFYLPNIIIIAYILNLIWELVVWKTIHPELTIMFFFTYACLVIIRALYRFPNADFKKTTILECMSDIYASPIKGKPISLNGQAIGRGVPGFIFGEDIMFKDNTGIIYLNYESATPIVGNWFFGLKKVEKLYNEPAEVDGWFMRGATHHLELKRYKTNKDMIKSYVRFWSIASSIIGVIIIGAILAYILS